MPQKSYPNVVYYNDDHSQTQQCTDKIKESLQLTFTTPSTWTELMAELELGCKFLAFHADMLSRTTHSTLIEFIDTINTIARFMPQSKDLKIAVIIKPTTPLSMIRSLQKTGVTGILLDLNYYTIEEVALSAKHHISGIPYWPKNIIDKLPGNKKLKDNTDKVILTARQNQIFRFIVERGASNKVIAKALGISESTVKLHLTAIFKKYGVRSRTQLAVFSQATVS